MQSTPKMESNTLCMGTKKNVQKWRTETQNSEEAAKLFYAEMSKQKDQYVKWTKRIEQN